MELVKNIDGTTLTIAAIGRLDTTTAPELEKEITESIPDMTALVLDFAELVYVSSAGLRVLLQAQKMMSRQGTMVVKNVCADIMEVLEMTGFSDILTIE